MSAWNNAPIARSPRGQSKVVDNDEEVASLGEHFARMRADITCATGNEDRALTINLVGIELC